MEKDCKGLTVYDRYLIGALCRLYPDEAACVARLVERLIRMGVVDPVRCKVMVVRRYVERGCATA